MKQNTFVLKYKKYYTPLLNGSPTFDIFAVTE